MPAVTAVLLHHNAMDRGTACNVVCQSRVEIAVLPAVSALLLHHSAMDTGTDCIVVSTFWRGKWLLCLQLLQFCYITVQWI